MHVKDGHEAHIERFISHLLSDEYGTRCFHLTRHRRKKYGGQWQTVQEKLLPGYVFITTDEPEQLYRELKKTENHRLLWSNDEYVAALEDREAELMEKITGNHKKPGVISLSQVVVDENGRTRVLSGPLLQVEDRIKKIDLHKRIAEIETDFMGEKKILYLGIELDGK